MSLTVYPYIRDKRSGEMIEIEASIKPPYNELFGFEIWRIKVWGAKVLKEMGCSILTTLKKSDIYAEEEEMDQLEIELIKVRNNIDDISDQLKVNKESLQFRIENALEAIKIAKQHHNGGVCIG